MSIEEKSRQETGKSLYADSSKEIGFSSEYVNWLEQQLRLYVVVKSLPTEEEMTLEKRKTFERINHGITTIDKFSYGLGFRKCFSWLAKDNDY